MTATKSSGKTGVLFVCLGNICRSPMAKAVFQHIVETNGISDQFVIDSAGTSRFHLGDKPDSRSAQTCRDRGVRVNHRARQTQPKDFDNFDFILCMDESNLDDLRMLKPKGSRAHVALFGSYSANAGDAVIRDPYYGGNKGFITNFEQVTRCSLGLLEELSFDNVTADFS
ncbi:Low molecular weight phosphotyrosine protein phosphatase [Coemansia sp. RSA 2049]|nr:Low molecular weight phosphotyrosine protein phosphatase [Coemansia sp. RSA 2049]